MMGDFNTHHTVWNCQDNDKNGKNLFEKLEEKKILMKVGFVQWYQGDRSN